MPYYVATRTKKNKGTDNWVIQSESFRLEKDALAFSKYHPNIGYKNVREAGGDVAVFSIADLKLLDVKIPKIKKPKVPNAAWLYSHTDQSHTRPVLGNINVKDLKGRGRYAIAADGFVIGAMPTDLEVGDYPGKDGNVYKGSPYPDYESIIPTDSQIGSIFHVSTIWLNSALKRAKVFSREASNLVLLTVRREHKSAYKMSGSNATLGVFGKSIEFGKSLDLLPCFLEGDIVVEAAFNVNYLLNALRGWKGHTQKPTHEFTRIHVPIKPKHHPIRNPIIIEPKPAPIATKDERLPFVVIMPMYSGV